MSRIRERICEGQLTRIVEDFTIVSSEPISEHEETR